MKLYGLKTCDTCRKALKSLPDAEFIDVRESGISEAVLTRALADFGAALVNTRSTTWRQLDAAEREKPPLHETWKSCHTRRLKEKRFGRSCRDPSMTQK